MKTLMIGWTTTRSVEEARTISNTLIVKKLAVCVQLEGPITSFYTWNNKLESSTEYRLMIKFIAQNAHKIEEFLKMTSSYDTPEWVAVPATIVSEKYLQWAISSE